MLKDHKLIGESVDYDDGKRKCSGKITGVKYAGIMTERKTLNITGRAIRVRIKPDDGSRAFWSACMKET